MINRVAVAVVAMTASASVAVAQDFEFHRELAPGSRFAVRDIIGDVRIEGTSGRTVTVSARKKPGRHGDPEDVQIKAIEISGGVAICVFYPGQYSRDARNRDDDRDRDRDRDRERSRARARDRDDRDKDRDDDDDDDRGNHPTRHRQEHDDPCHRDNDWHGNNRNDTSVEFVIRLPAGLKVDAKTVSGDVIAQGLRGSLDLGTVSGDLRLTDAEGDVLDAASVSGNVELDRIVAREVSAETVSGNVTFVGALDSRGAYDFKTLSGDVIVTLPRQPDAKVSAVTFSGDLDSDFPVSGDSRHRRHRFNATWGAGTASLDLESFSGDIKIRSSR